MLRERPLSQLHFAQLIQLATGTRGNRYSPRRGVCPCFLMIILPILTSAGWMKIRYLWPSQWSGMKVIYLVNKYSPLIDIVFLIQCSFPPSVNLMYCADQIVVLVASNDPHVSFAHSYSLFFAHDPFSRNAESSSSCGHVRMSLVGDGALADVFMYRLLRCGNIVLRT